MYHYTAVKIIDTTALVELLENKHLKKEKEIVNIYEMNDRILLVTSRNDIMEEIESLYPNVFIPIESPLLNGKIIFTIK